jgi:hypothetical protein
VNPSQHFDQTVFDCRKSVIRASGNEYDKTKQMARVTQHYHATLALTAVQELSESQGQALLLQVASGRQPPLLGRRSAHKLPTLDVCFRFHPEPEGDDYAH